MRLIFALGCFAAAIGVAFAQDPNPTTIGPKHCQVGSEVIVPNILGFKPAMAKQIAENCGLVWSFSDHPQTISYEAIGTIGDQEPSGGKLLKKGDTLRGFLSKGVFIPNFIGWQVKDVEVFVTDLRHGFVAKWRRDKAPVGQVIEQDPLNAIFYNSGLPVSVVASEGPWVHIPNLVGERHDVAVQKIKSLMLNPIHAGGDLSSGSKKQTIYEFLVWYPVVETISPNDQAFEGDAIKLTTKRRTDVIFSPQPGKQCP